MGSYKYTKEVLEEAVKDVFSYAQLIKKLGKRQSGGLQHHLTKLVKFYETDVSHFKGKGWAKGTMSLNKRDKQSFINNILCLNGKGWNGSIIRDRLIEFNIKKYECEICNNTKWLNKKIKLELHHLDGNNKNNELNNLQLLCPNCHSFTDNHGVYNIKKDSGYVKVTNKCINCRCVVKNRSTRCVNCEHIRRGGLINKPSVDILKKEVKESSYIAVGRKYGVSHTTVKRWINKNSL